MKMHMCDAMVFGKSKCLVTGRFGTVRLKMVWAITPPKFVSALTTTFPEDPFSPNELTDYKPLLWPDHEVLPFHCPHPVTGKAIAFESPFPEDFEKVFGMD